MSAQTWVKTLPTNPFEPLYARCNAGDNASNYANLPKFPSLIDIEPVGLCNFRCLFCPTGLLAVTRPQGFMSWETHKTIVDQCAEHGTAIRYIQWGEPLLHPQFVEFIEYAHGAGLLTHLNTNASKLTSELATRLVRAGLSSIKFSFQGVNRETYAEMRQVDFFDGMLAAIRAMQEARSINEFPYIAASTSITNETPEQVETFRALMAPLVDHLSIGRTIFDFIPESAIRLRPHQKEIFAKVKAFESAAKEHPRPCPEITQKISIQWDGAAVVCCNDWNREAGLGNVNERPISEIWRDKTIEMYRKTLAKDDYSLPLCKDCFSYMDLTPAA